MEHNRVEAQVHGASPNWQIAGNADPNAQLLISLSIRNVGDRATTITHVFGFEYENYWQRLQRKRLRALVIPQPGGQPLPHILQPGGTYLGLVEQREAGKAIAEGHLVDMGFHHSMADKPVLQRLTIPPEKNSA